MLTVILETHANRKMCRELSIKHDIYGDQANKLKAALRGREAMTDIEVGMGVKRELGRNPDILICPRLQHVSDGEFTQILEYVKAGGTVIATVHSLLYDTDRKLHWKPERFRPLGMEEKGPITARHAKLINLQKGEISFEGGVNTRSRNIRIIDPETAEGIGAVEGAKGERSPALIRVSLGKGALLYFNLGLDASKLGAGDADALIRYFIEHLLPAACVHAALKGSKLAAQSKQVMHLLWHVEEPGRDRELAQRKIAAIIKKLANEDREDLTPDNLDIIEESIADLAGIDGPWLKKYDAAEMSILTEFLPEIVMARLVPPSEEARAELIITLDDPLGLYEEEDKKSLDVSLPLGKQSIERGAHTLGGAPRNSTTIHFEVKRYPTKKKTVTISGDDRKILNPEKGPIRIKSMPAKGKEAASPGSPTIEEIMRLAGKEGDIKPPKAAKLISINTQKRGEATYLNLTVFDPDWQDSGKMFRARGLSRLKIHVTPGKCIKLSNRKVWNDHEYTYILYEAEIKGKGKIEVSGTDGYPEGEVSLEFSP